MIITKQLLLRRARMSDLDDLHQVFSNPAAMRFWDSLPYQEIEQTQRLLEAMIAASPDESDDFVIEHEGRAIGKAGCWRLGEIGFILHPDHWGKGLAHEALSAAIPHIFENLPIDRLEADVDPRNDASLKLLSRLGFRETGRAARTILVGDEWCDSVYLELPVATWRQTAPD
ncbi:GNAT family N-acetyltransferase [Hoeflea sp. WL0058]|uniref:GNAT family N-acetyltransferase n=1 Tax=Flavimaribacter sediminis TaxID=2865987 RepID=A0AAE2ZLP9_9HYPH|nr:GNAT family N-acetyltransferase [Flavimaribacter sediminis]MBW8637171.1 GNAT family N-acetyltransferase [Flavimaribacter sediminis]